MAVRIIFGKEKSSCGRVAWIGGIENLSLVNLFSLCKLIASQTEKYFT